MESGTTIDGINENVEAFGRLLHVQTEVTGGPRSVIRSTVFLDGAVVASRETPLDGGDASRDGIQDRMQSQHWRIIHNLQRTSGLEEALMSSPDLSDARAPVASRRTSSTPEDAPCPDPTSDPHLLSSVCVRQLIGPFSLALRPSPYHDVESVRGRIETAARMIDQIMTAPHFSDVRLDEQVRFFDLRERIAAWRGAGRDPETGDQILLAMVAFAAHLRRISDRRELQVFDYQLLTWAMAALGRDGASPQVLESLRALAGRDADLDGLLSQSEPVAKEHLLQVLMELLDRTLP